MLLTPSNQIISRFQKFEITSVIPTSEPKFQVICPTAPMMPVTLNGGMSMPAWYDILSLDENDKNREDMEGVDWSVNFVRDIIKEEEKHGVQSDRVVVGGFSQGGAVSLRTALTSLTPLAGCIALSCYLPGDPTSYQPPSHNIPIFQVQSLFHCFRQYLFLCMILFCVSGSWRCRWCRDISARSTDSRDRVKIS